MKCNTCGRETQNDKANFCDYCGSSFREPAPMSINMAPREQVYQDGTRTVPGMMPMQFGNGLVGTQNASETEKPVSFLNWLGTYGIMFIPFVGWLIFFIMLFVWAFNNQTPASKKNWARVTLIFVAILIVLIIGYLIVLISSSMFQDMMNGTFDYSSYYNNLYQNAK